MKRLILCLSILTSLTVSACGFVNGVVPSKNYVTQKVNVGRFNGITTSCSIDVIYTQTSGSQSVEITASDNIMPYIKVRVEGGILKVGMQNNTGIRSIGSHKMEVRVNAPAVNMLGASSSGDVILTNGLNAKGDVKLRASSSGDIKGGDIHCYNLDGSSSSSGSIILGNVKCNTLNANCSSSGDFKLESVECDKVEAGSSSAGDLYLAGKCNYANFNASSSGDVHAKNLHAKVVEARASSAGDVSCYASQSIVGRRSSAGDISFEGNPARVDIRR